MSTDKTLADVQPGGMVRLGDQASAQGCDELRMRTDGERAAYLEGVAEGRRAVLSAQPSPGGQGDVLVNPRDCNSGPEGEWYCEKHPDALMGHDDCSGAGIPASARLFYTMNWLRLARQEIRELHAQYGFLAEAALAARQPVDPERGHIDPSWSLHDRVEFALRDAGFDLDEAAFVAEAADRARQPVELIAQKVGDYRVTVAEDAITVSRGRDIVFAYSAGDPEPINASQPVGEPFAYGSSAGHQPIPASVYYPDNEACRELYDIPLYAAPPAQPVGEAVELARAKVKIAALELQLATYEAPAQAVDLERFRGTVKSQYSMTEWMHRCGFVSAEKLEESKKNHDHLMALIDSQAVGQ